MSEHTPGPWAWCETGSGAVLRGEHGKRPIILDCGRVGLADDFVMRGRDAKRDLIVRLDTMSPNERLIEAAPDLLEVCEIAAIQGSGYLGDCALQVLKKVKGEDKDA